ncbi:MAG TPA: hypothetical protein VH741_11080, partial [Candidatus Limnocylindrales bacterium]
YDTATGLLVAANTSTAGATSPFNIVGEAPPQGNTQLTLTRLVNVRERTLPATAGSRPDWVVAGRQLRYAGEYNWTNPIDPSSGNLSYPVEHLVSIDRVGAGWAETSARTLVPALGQDQLVRGVSGPAGLYWFDPASLRTLVQGQALDADPVTTESVTVSFVGQAGDGTSVAVIDSQLPGVATRAVYDSATGTLVSYDLRLASTGITISLRLVETR